MIATAEEIDRLLLVSEFKVQRKVPFSGPLHDCKIFAKVRFQVYSRVVSIEAAISLLPVCILLAIISQTGPAAATSHSAAVPLYYTVVFVFLVCSWVNIGRRRNE